MTIRIFTNSGALNSGYLKALITEYGARKYEMTENYRSKSGIVDFANYFVTKLTARMKESLGTSVQSDAGIVSLTHYTSANLEEPVVTQIVNRKAMGKVCVLTNTNDEALRIVGLLLKNDRRAKLIQSMDGFQLNNLTEIRYFLNEIDKRLSSPVIPTKYGTLQKINSKRFISQANALRIVCS